MRIDIKNLIIIALLFSPLATLYADTNQLGLSGLVRSALSENADVVSTSLDAEAERLRYEAAKAGNLPSLSFTTDSGNNPLYRYSNAEEFSTATFSSDRYQRHTAGGGISLGLSMPTGGNLSLTGAGSMGFSLAEDSDEWAYIVNPAGSLYFRQPLFTDRVNGAPIRFDSLRLADELADLSVKQAEISRTAAENNLIIAVVNTATALNNLKNTYDLLTERLELGQRRLELALLDEQAGRLSRLDRLSEELLIRRQQEALIELDFQIESLERNLEQLTGQTGFAGKMFMFDWPADKLISEVDPLNSAGVMSSGMIARSLELSGTIVPNGNEPVFEMTGLVRRAGQDEVADISEAFSDAGSDEVNVSLTMALSFSALDWGETKKKREADRATLSAAEARLEAAEQNAVLQVENARRDLELIEEKLALLVEGLEYDESLIEREQLRFEAGLSSEVALDTIRLDRKDREYQIQQLGDERSVAILVLLNSGGVELRRLFE